MINFNKTIDRIGIAVVIVAFFTYPAYAETTYTPPQNIYLPEMMFLVVKDTDSLGITRCKNMAYRTVDSFSRRANSNLVRQTRNWLRLHVLYTTNASTLQLTLIGKDYE